MFNITFHEAAKLTEDEAREYIEQVRWNGEPVCIHCGTVNPYKINRKTQKGVYRCRSKECAKQFTVTVGTVFERSHIPLNKWLMATALMAASKKGISAHQIHRMLGVTYKSAWFMMHRLRFAMTQTPMQEKLKGVVEVDETYIGGKAKGKRGRGADKKQIVVSLVQRDGTVRSKHVQMLTANELKGYIRENVDKDCEIMTDDFKSYKGLDKEFKKHNIIKHSKREYVKGNIHTNTVEGFFGLLKRGVKGSFHHVSGEHLHRYLAEFDFRWNRRKVSDSERTQMLLSAVEGKRLMYCHSS